jgi:hypothetical protein
VLRRLAHCELWYPTFYKSGNSCRNATHYPDIPSKPIGKWFPKRQVIAQAPITTPFGNSSPIGRPWRNLPVYDWPLYSASACSISLYMSYLSRTSVYDGRSEGPKVKGGAYAFISSIVNTFFVSSTLYVGIFLLNENPTKKHSIRSHPFLLANGVGSATYRSAR